MKIFCTVLEAVLCVFMKPTLFTGLEQLCFLLLTGRILFLLLLLLVMLLLLVFLVSDTKWLAAMMAGAGGWDTGDSERNIISRNEANISNISQPFLKHEGIKRV